MKLLPSRLAYPIIGAVLLLLWTTSPALALNEPTHALVNTEALVDTIDKERAALGLSTIR